MDNFVGKCLIARPNIQDPLFKNSVVFVFEQTDLQISGIIINRKSNFTTHDMLAKLGLVGVVGRETVYTGGPVAKQSIIMLHTNEWTSTSTFKVTGKYSISSDDLMLKRFASGDTPKGYKFCAGAAVWHSKQLQNEISANNWLCVELSKHVIFDFDGLSQWDLAVECAAKKTIEQFF